MRKSIFTSTVAALALFAVIGLVSALAPFVPWPNLARAHSPGEAALTALRVTAGGTAQTLSPTFDRAVYYYTIPVADSVTQITIEGTPDGDGTVAYQNLDGTALPDADATTPGQQVDIPTAGKRINVVVSHTDGGSTTTKTYGVLVIREGPAATDTIALMALYNSTNGPNWTAKNNWGSAMPLHTWAGVSTRTSDGRVISTVGPRRNYNQHGWDPAGRIRQPHQPAATGPRRQPVERGDPGLTKQPHQPAHPGPGREPVERRITG